MQITTHHSASSYGQPVIIGDGGQVMDYAPGVKAVRAKLALSTRELAGKCGISHRTVEAWECGKLMPSAAALNVMADLL